MSESAGPQVTTVRRLRREAWGFAVGSACFFVGALPWYVEWLGVVAANLTFFICTDTLCARQVRSVSENVQVRE